MCYRICWPDLCQLYKRNQKIKKKYANVLKQDATMERYAKCCTTFKTVQTYVYVWINYHFKKIYSKGMPCFISRSLIVGDAHFQRIGPLGRFFL